MCGGCRHSYGSVGGYPAAVNYGGAPAYYGGAGGYYGASAVGGPALVQSTNLIQGGVGPNMVSSGGFVRQGGAVTRNSYERLPARANVIDAGINVRKKLNLKIVF